jgi:hypothetical protein
MTMSEDWRVRITIAGVDFTSVECETKREAQMIHAGVRGKDCVQRAEVETA